MARGKTPVPERPGLALEEQLWAEGLRRVAGLDEAGRGAWAGPVYAAAVVLPADARIVQLLAGVRDSKRMSAKQRSRWRDCICAAAVDWAVGFSTNGEIDMLGIVTATCLAMTRALEGLKHQPQHLLVDYLTIPDCAFPQNGIAKGDAISLSIAAASVLAKTGRDAAMRALEEEYVGYGFGRHKGYGTTQHRAALEARGLSAVHRRSFAPMKRMG